MQADTTSPTGASTPPGTQGDPSPLVAVTGLSVIFDGPSGPVTAVDDVTLAVRRGEFMVIVGPSGCGKTTLLRVLAGLESPSAGTVDRAPVDGRPQRNAMVFQGRSVFPWMRVDENIGYGLELAGASREARQAKVDELLRLVGLTRFARSYPHQLSEGMRQRVAIARALAVEPDLLLMDEPFGALDEQTRFILQDELLRIWETSGKTVVFVTHSIDEALTLADRVVIMSAHPGRIREEIAVPIPRPRDLASVRSDPAFADLFGSIWGVLQEEVQQARAIAGEVQ